MSDANNRDFSRVHSAHRVLLAPEGGESIDGTLRDVSATGLFVRTDKTLPPGTPCAITVVLTDDAEGIGVRARGAIIRIEDEGLAVKIETIVGENSFEHLRRLIMYNTESLHQAENEFENHIGLKAQD